MWQSIIVNNLGKAYKRYPSQWARLQEWLDPAQRPRHEAHWVLHDVSFTVAPGEAVGIIGNNGAGKSTLLKIITGAAQPTVGTVAVQGQIAALLELGMGFHPDFTGRQNVFMAGQLLGHSAATIDEHFSAIEAFAEIGDYIDLPVRTYSSGMQVRLAFSVATALRPDVLIVDEALSVGDIFFQQKCFARIRSFREQGTTLLFVTHTLGVVYSLCDRGILLDHGQVILDDRPKPVIDLYQALDLQRRNASCPVAKPAAAASSPVAEPAPTVTPLPMESPPASATLESAMGDIATGHAVIDQVQLASRGQAITAVISEEPLDILITVQFHRACQDPHIGFQLRDARGEPVFMTNTYCMRESIGPVAAGQRIQATFSFRAALAPAVYTLTAGVANGGVGEGDFHEMLARRQNAISLTVLKNIEAIQWSGVYNLAPALSLQWLAAPQTA